MNQPNIIHTGEFRTVRTINDPTIKQAEIHLQVPVGQVICPHCHKAVPVAAKGIYDTIGGPIPDNNTVKFPGIMGAQPVVCDQCSGPFCIGKRGDKLVLTPQTVGQSILEAEAIIAERQTRNLALQQQCALRPKDS